MRAVSVLAIEYYKRTNPKNFQKERFEETKQLILKEVTKWSIKSMKHGNNYFFKPTNFTGTETSPAFEVRLVDSETEWGHTLKFGDLNKPTDTEKYYWSDDDTKRMQKALFLIDVLENHVAKLLMDGKIKAMSFSPYDKDDLGSDRLSYFKRMFDKINKNKEFSWVEKDDNYLIRKK
jgi:hypothetical protein